MKKGFILLFLIVSIVMSGVEVIKVATPKWEDQTNKDGTGIYFDIIREVFAIDGIEMEYKIVPWKRAEGMVTHGKADVMCGEYFEENSVGIFPRYPISYEIASLVYKKDKGIIWKGEETLAAKKILWPKGYDYHEELEVNVNYTEVVDTNAGIKNLINNRGVFYLDDLIDIKAYFEENIKERDAFEIQDLLESYLYLVFSPNEKGKKYVDIFDKNMKILLERGKVEEIFNKYELEYRELKPRK